MSEVAADLRRRIASDPFALSLGIELLDLAPGYARLTMLVREDMMNFHGNAHGGVIFSLADAAFAAASNSHGTQAVGLNVNISIVRATTAGTRLYATGREENLTRRTGLYRLTVEDEEGNLVALAEGLVYRKERPVVERDAGSGSGVTP